VVSCCEFGIKPSGSIKCWETIECPNNWGANGATRFSEKSGSGKGSIQPREYN
jgi:hypothetical protein